MLRHRRESGASTKTVVFCSHKPQLTDAGPTMFDCQPGRDPGAARSRLRPCRPEACQKVAGGGAKRHPRTTIQNLQPTPEGSHNSSTPPGCRETFRHVTGGLRFAATPGYHLPTLRVGCSHRVLRNRRTSQISDRSQPPMTVDLSQSESADSRSLDRLGLFGQSCSLNLGAASRVGSTALFVALASEMGTTDPCGRSPCPYETNAIS